MGGGEPGGGDKLGVRASGRCKGLTCGEEIGDTPPTCEGDVSPDFESLLVNQLNITLEQAVSIY